MQQATKKKAAKKKATGKKVASNVIALPKPRKASFDPDRTLKGNSLLSTQVEQFHKIEQEYEKHLRSGMALKSIRTEGQAAEYIRRVTVLLQSGRQRTKTEGGEG